MHYTPKIFTEMQLYLNDKRNISYIDLKNQVIIKSKLQSLNNKEELFYNVLFAKSRQTQFYFCLFD